MDMMYLNAMMLNATIPSYDAKDKDSKETGKSMSFFEFGQQLAGIK